MNRLILAATIVVALLVASSRGSQPEDGGDVKLEGTWTVVSKWGDGKLIEQGEPTVFTFTDGKLRIDDKEDLWKNTLGIQVFKMTYSVKRTTVPKEMDILVDIGSKRVIAKAIYVLEADRLKIYTLGSDEPRPKRFPAKGPDKGRLWIMKRIESAKGKKAE